MVIRHPSASSPSRVADTVRVSLLNRTATGCPGPVICSASKSEAVPRVRWIRSLALAEEPARPDQGLPPPASENDASRESSGRTRVADSDSERNVAERIIYGALILGVDGDNCSRSRPIDLARIALEETP